MNGQIEDLQCPYCVVLRRYAPIRTADQYCSLCGRSTRALQGIARPGAFTEEEMQRYREAWSRPGASRGMLNWYRAGLRHPPRKLEDPRVEPPTLIIWGAADRWLGREMVQPSVELCRDGRAEFVEEATHWVQHEEPDLVNRLLIDFLQ